MRRVVASLVAAALVLSVGNILFREPSSPPPFAQPPAPPPRPPTSTRRQHPPPTNHTPPRPCPSFQESLNDVTSILRLRSVPGAGLHAAGLECKSPTAKQRREARGAPPSPRCEAPTTDVLLAYLKRPTSDPDLSPLSPLTPPNRGRPPPSSPPALSSVLARHSESFPDAWAHTLCPEVVRHFSRAPLFRTFPGPSAPFPNILTTEAALSGTCLLKLVGQAADRAGATWVVYAGTHVGALVHGGPVPWDDDLDVLVEHARRGAFEAELRSTALPGGAVLGVSEKSGRPGTLKVFVEVRRGGGAKESSPHTSPRGT